MFWVAEELALEIAMNPTMLFYHLQEYNNP